MLTMIDGTCNIGSFDSHVCVI